MVKILGPEFFGTGKPVYEPQSNSTFGNNLTGNLRN